MIIGEDTQNKLIELGLYKWGEHWYYKNHFESFIYNSFNGFCCCIYDFTIKKNNSGQLKIYHKSSVNVRDENRLVDLMKDVIKRYKEITIELKKRELENDF